MAEKTGESNYDVLFKYVNIVTGDGSQPINIIQQVVHIDIFESILSPVIMCTIHLSDKINLLENIPIIQKKIFIELEYITYGLEGGVKRRFIVNEVGNRVYDSQLKTNNYTLQCLSEEVLSHSNHILNKVVAGEEISNEIKRIVSEELNSKKPVYTDQTKGSQVVQISNLKPFQAIDKLRQRAVSSKYLSNSYLFFENQNGFNFVTLEWLIKNMRGTVDNYFYLTLGDSNQSLAGRVRNVLGYQGVVHDNTTDVLASGGLNTLHKRHDIATGVVQEFSTKPDIDFFINDTGISGALTPNFIAENSKKPSKQVYTLHDSTTPETYAWQLPLKSFYVSMCTKHITRIYTYGDAAISCGSSLDLQLPVVSSNEEEQGSSKYSKMLSGRHLISKVRHMFNVQGRSTITYHMSMELIRPAYGETTSV